MSRTLYTSHKLSKPQQQTAPTMSSDEQNLTDVQQLQHLFQQQQNELLRKQREIMAQLQQSGSGGGAASGSLSPPPASVTQYAAAAQAIAPTPPIVIQPMGPAGETIPSPLKEPSFNVPVIPGFMKKESVKEEEKGEAKPVMKTERVQVLSGGCQTKIEPKPESTTRANKGNSSVATDDDLDVMNTSLTDVEEQNNTEEQPSSSKSNSPEGRRTSTRRKRSAAAAAVVVTGKTKTVETVPGKMKATARKSMPNRNSEPAAKVVQAKVTRSSSPAAKPVGPSRVKLTARKSTAGRQINQPMKETAKDKEEKTVDKEERCVEKEEKSIGYRGRKAASAANRKIKEQQQDVDDTKHFESDLSDDDHDYNPAKDKSDDDDHFSGSNYNLNRGPGRPPKYMKFLADKTQNKSKVSHKPASTPAQMQYKNLHKLPDDYKAKPPPELPDEPETSPNNRGTKIRVAAVNVIRLTPPQVSQLRAKLKDKAELPEQLLKKQVDDPHQAPQKLLQDLWTAEDVDDGPPPPKRSSKPGPASKKKTPKGQKEEELFAYDESAGIACREGDGKITLPIDVKPSKNTAEDPRFRTLFIGPSGNLKNKWLKVIMKDINGEPTNQCLTCCFASTDPVEVAMHEETYHQDKHECDASVNKPGPNQLFLECRHCNYVTTDRLCLWFHFRNYHKVPKILNCSYKLNDTSYIDAKMPHLTPYLQEHSKEMYKCPMEGCKQMSIQGKFVVKHVMKEHITKDEIVSPGFVKIIQEKRTNQNAPAVARDVYVCVECFYVTQGLAHMNTHNYSLHTFKNMLYICKFCQEQFVNSQKVLVHCTKNHEGQSPTATVTLIKNKCMEDPFLAK